MTTNVWLWQVRQNEHNVVGQEHERLYRIIQETIYKHFLINVNQFIFHDALTNNTWFAGKMRLTF